MAQKKQWDETSKKEKLVGSITLVVIIIVAIAIVGAIMGGHKPTSNNSAATSAKVSPADAIKTAVSKDLGGTNDVGGKYYRNIDVEPQASGGYGVFVDYNADEASNNNDDKTMYTEKAEQLYKTIYSQTGENIATASVSAYFAGTDQYGNSSDKLVYKTILDKSVADKVNWKADDTTLQIDLPNLWSVTQNFLQ